METKTKTADMNRVSYETAAQLSSVLLRATNEIKGERTVGEAVESKIYCDLFDMQTMAFFRQLRVDRRKQQYEGMDMPELLKALYDSVVMYHHYGACKSRDLKGIAWSMEGSVFVLRLGECAVNMEHSVFDEVTFHDDNLRETDKDNESYKCRLFAIGYDSDIDCESGEHKGHYEEALNFLCEFKDWDGNVETRDVALCDVWHHKELLRDILAQLNVIADMANENLTMTDKQKASALLSFMEDEWDGKAIINALNPYLKDEDLAVLYDRLAKDGVIRE